MPFTVLSPGSKPWGLILEIAIIFVAMPLLFRHKRFYLPPLPVLWAVTLYCLVRLRRDTTFDQHLLWNIAPLRGQLVSILVGFAVTALLILAAVHHVRAQALFNFVRRAPAFWALVMVLYPILSVYPQGIVFRAFLLHRLGPWLPGPWLPLLASAALFAFMHIIFRNRIAVAFTFVGGLLFAWRYQRTGSLAVSSFEHALYGCWMFTVGLGEYFYKGAR